MTESAPTPSATGLLTRLAAERLAARVWSRDTTPFAPAGAGDAVHEAVRQRLGWLDAPSAIGGRAADLAAFAREIRAEGLNDVFLLGMGGSSLCAEVLRDVAAGEAACRLTVLDTTDERAIRQVTDELDARTALFIVASKSGSTIEVTALERHFWTTASHQLADATGRHFIAITDPGTALEALAVDRGYRRTFVNPPDIGGRYSALSLFGLVPAALLDLDLKQLEGTGASMAKACGEDGSDNPGLALGAFMAAHALAGRDKLTLILPPGMAALGTWIEQLVAESTGKLGRGVLPVVGEPTGVVEDYGPDRAFVAVGLDDSPEEMTLARNLERAGRPVFWIAATPRDLGGEFFRWEFATAVAGAALGVNPFDEPNVREAKQRTKAQLDARRLTGAFKIDPPFERGPGYSRRAHERSGGDPGAGRYIAILDYLPADPRREALMRRLRGALRAGNRLATTHGVGPRYLHSTGQYHKGGPNTGAFVMLTAADASATPVPDADYTFATLKQAQALGDFDALAAAGRDVVHYHIDSPSADFTETLERILGQLGARP